MKQVELLMKAQVQVANATQMNLVFENCGANHYTEDFMLLVTPNEHENFLQNNPCPLYNS